MIFFTSDQHFGHANIIQYCNRPFSSVEEMDVEMIKRWNEVISDDDIVYHLGDFTLGNDIHKFLRRLRGNIHFVTLDFHHDTRWIKDNPDVTSNPILFIKVEDVNIMLCHYPIAVWERSHYGSWHLYGHVHRKDFILPGFTMNIGVDHHNFYPVSLDKVKQHMIDLGWTPEWKASFIKDH